MSDISVIVPKVNRFKGAKVTKNVKFMNQDIDVVKLTVAQVIKIQEMSKEFEANPSEVDNIKILSFVIREGAPELRDLSEEDFNDFPMGELTTLSNHIMLHSGLAGGEQKGK